MRRLILWTVILVCVGVAVFPVRGTADGDLKILTYPIGLVTGAHPIETDLGAEGKPAELYLDGVSVCSLRASKSQCTVDLGDAPHVHLLELIRRDAAGRVAARSVTAVEYPARRGGRPRPRLFSVAGRSQQR